MSARRTWLLSAALAAVGCGEKIERVQVQPVTGKVTANGKPVYGAVLVFVPANSTDPDAIRPRGLSGDDGSFVLQTYDPGDGVPPGDYLVSVRWTGPKKAAPPTKPADPDADGAIMGPPKDYFGGRYADPRKSGLRVTVRPGDTALPPIVLN